MILHRVATAVRRPAHARFRRALADVEAAQREALAAALRGAATVNPAAAGLARASWEELGRRVPPTCWEDHASWIEALRAARPRGVRFEPTSGSTASRKWIPYTPAFRRSLDEAAAAWMNDLAERHPGILRGRHHWSLSWRPDDLRAQGGTADDLELLAPATRLLLARLMAVPGGVGRLPTSEAALVAMLVHLAGATDLALVSVWSPTFLLRLLEALRERREGVAAVLASGRWDAAGGTARDVPWAPPRNPGAAAFLRAWNGAIGPEVTRALWPRLSLVSAWDSSTSRAYADELRSLFPHAAFQGKGLWATEGAVTIPFAGEKPIAATSHAIELRCLATGAIRPPWRVEPGQEVQPLLTAANGLVRYALPDRCRVTGHLGTAPCLEFLGRMGGVDLVGEKLDAALAQRVLDALAAELRCRPVALVAVPDGAGEAPHYRVLAEPGPGAPSAERVAARAEALLGAIHQYSVARELAQLGPARACVRGDALAEYHRCVGAAAGADGEVKIEPVLRLRPDRAAGGVA
jgi:hypothetical protein